MFIILSLPIVYNMLTKFYFTLFAQYIPLEKNLDKIYQMSNIIML